MSEIQIGDFEYLCGRMPTRVQFHVARRILPVMKGLQPLFATMGRNLMSTYDANGNGALVPDTNVTIFEGLAALSDTLGMMSDADADYIIDHALDAVRWKQAGRWAPLRINGALVLPAADALDVQLRLTWEVLGESLGNFSLAIVLGSQTTNGMDQNPSLSH
jgi:hypothetical protein